MARRKTDLVFGRQPVLELLRSGEAVDKILLQKGITGESVTAVKNAARDARVPWQTVPREALNRHVSGNHQGMLAYTAEVQYLLLEDLIPMIYERGEVPFLVLLDGITDVRNFGAIARTALAAGAHGIIIGMRDVARAGSDALKASAGALRQIPVCRESSTGAAADMLRQHGLTLVGLTGDGQKLPWESDMRVPVALVAGSEGRGISQEVREQLDIAMRLPMPGDFDSYNVSVAMGMAAYEVARQRMP